MAGAIGDTIIILAGIAAILYWLERPLYSNKTEIEPAPIMPHRCQDWGPITTAGDGVMRCRKCYEKELKRARFCGEEWPAATEAFNDQKPV